MTKLIDKEMCHMSRNSCSKAMMGMMMGMCAGMCMFCGAKEYDSSWIVTD